MQLSPSHSSSASTIGNSPIKPAMFLILVWCVFVARGVFYSAVLPVWEGYDEPFHFAFVQYLVTNGHLPVPADLVSREIQTSLHLLPLPGTLQKHGYPPPILTHDAFWRLDAQQRQRLQQEFRRIPGEWAKEPSAEPIRNYEAQQPPLYYVLFSPALCSVESLDLASRVLLLRVLSVVVSSLVIPLGYLVARKVLRNETTALHIVALATMMPELMVNISRVGNESLAIVLYTLLVYVSLKLVDGPKHFRYLPLAGLLIGLGLLTKAYFLTALPALFVILAWCLWRYPSHWKALAGQSAAATCIIVAVAGSWYWRAHQVLGSWSGLYSDAALHGTSRSELLRQIWHVNWLSAAISVALSHIWYGAWSFLRVSNAVYLAFGAVMVLAAVGTAILFVKFWRTTTDKEWEAPSRGHFIILTCFYTFFCLGLAYQVLTLFISEGTSASTGWYIYCLVIPELILVYSGLRSVLPFRLHPWILPSLIAAFALLDLYGMHFLLIPYYSGIISHSAVYEGVFSHNVLSRVPTAGMQQLVRTGLNTFAERLVINKPIFLTTRTLLLLWLVYCLASSGLTASSWLRGRSRRQPGSGQETPLLGRAVGKAR